MVWRDLANERQIAAIASELRNNAVIAGPGTGKTRTLLVKAVQLIEEEVVTPDQIRIVNFTNSGVIDLRSKVATDSNYFEVCAENISTFHSLALRALSRVAGSKNITIPRLTLLGSVIYITPAPQRESFAMEVN